MSKHICYDKIRASHPGVKISSAVDCYFLDTVYSARLRTPHFHSSSQGTSYYFAAILSNQLLLFATKCRAISACRAAYRVHTVFLQITVLCTASNILLSEK
jgi:hypothetical protein